MTPARLKALLTVLRWALNIAAIIAVGLFFVQHRDGIRQAAGQFDPATLLVALTVVLAGLLPGAWAWQRLCARRLPAVTPAYGMLVYLRSAIGKYTPGGVLSFVVQQRLLSRYGSRPAVLVQIFAGTALAACLSAALLGLPAAYAFGVPGEGWWITGGAVLGALAVAWAWRSGLWTRMGLPPPLPFAQATVLLGGAAALTGVHLAVLGGGDVLFLVSAYALSTIIGLVFAVLPGAVGARDGALLLILVTRLEPADAAMLAILSRALIVAGDVLGASLSGLILRFTSLPLHLEKSTA